MMLDTDELQLELQPEGPLAYLEQEIKPRLGKDTELFGVADAAAKRDLLSRASAMLFPICWEEPFGLVVIEAMACGTPVVALRRGSVPEIIVNGVTGIIKDAPSQLPEGIEQARRLDPAACRAHVAARFNTYSGDYKNFNIRIGSWVRASASSCYWQSRC